MKSRSHSWFWAALTAGALLAAVLIVNAVINYVVVSRRVAAEQLRRDMRSHVATLDREIRQATDLAALQSVLDRVPATEGFAWAELRTRGGELVCRRGFDAGVSFGPSQIASRLRTREPLYEIRDTASGRVVVELFPVRLGNAGAGQIEMAMWLDQVPGFWPLQRSLIISCCAGVALLVSLVVIRLRFPQYLRGRRLEAEVEVAREVQRSLLPDGREALRNVSLAAEFLPAAAVSGDLYDVFENEAGLTALVAGDVSGKGVPAALLMGVIHGAVHSSNWLDSAEAHREATERLNRLLAERTPGASFATLFWGAYHPRQGQLRYINAGHCPPLLVRPKHDAVEINTLDEGGPVLGLLRMAHYVGGVVDLRPGDTLVLYSDGLVEAASRDGEQFGEERLREVLKAAAGRTPQDIKNAVIDAIRSFAGEAPLSDDLMLVAVQLHTVNRATGPDRDSVLEEGAILVA